MPARCSILYSCLAGGLLGCAAVGGLLNLGGHMSGTPPDTNLEPPGGDALRGVVAVKLEFGLY